MYVSSTRHEPADLACEAIPALLELRSVMLHQRKIVLGARETPRSPSSRRCSRYESLYWRYQRTHRTMIAASKWRPLTTAARLSSLLTRPLIHERSVAHLPDMVQR